MRALFFRHQLGGGVYFDTDESLTYSFTIRGYVGNWTEIFLGVMVVQKLLHIQGLTKLLHILDGTDGLKNVFFRNKNFTYLTMGEQKLG